MKHILLFLSVAFASISVSTAQRWQVQLGAIGGNNLNDIQILNDSTAFVVGNNGLIAYTTNKGRLWGAVFPPTRESIRSIHFTSASEGYILVGEGELYYTEDGGLSWEEVGHDHGGGGGGHQHDHLENLAPARFFNFGRGLVAGSEEYPSAPTGYKGVIKLTADSAETFTEVYESEEHHTIFDLTIAGSRAYAVAFPNILLRSSDAGATWQEVALGSAAAFASKVATFGNGQIVYVGKKHRHGAGLTDTLFRSTNGGESWVGIPLADIEGVASLSFFDANTGVLVDEEGHIFRTTNGGQDWIEVADAHLTSSHVAFSPSGNTTITVGLNGKIYGSVDAGLTWAEQTLGSSLEFKSVKAVSRLDAFVLAKEGLFHTEDGGDTWHGELFPDSLKGKFNSLFLAGNAAWLVGLEGKIYTTTDKGVTLQQVNSGVTEELKSISASGTTVLVVGHEGKIIRSSNGGAFATVSSGTTEELLSVAILNNLAFAVGEEGTILRSTDAGSTWANIPTGILRELTAVQIVNNNVAYAAGHHGYLLKTTDAGLTWHQQVLPPFVHLELEALQFTSAHRGWALGEEGAVIYTTNGGELWSAEENIAPVNFKSVNFANANTAWAIAEGGFIFKFSDNADTTSDATPVIPTFSYRSSTDTLKNLPNMVLVDSAFTAPGTFGYLVGMSQTEDEEFAEKYIINGKARVVGVQSHHRGRVTNGNNIMEVQIYNIDPSNGLPYRVIGKKDLYTRDINLTGAATITNFNQPVAVSDSFYVSFNFTDYAHGDVVGDTLGLMHGPRNSRPSTDPILVRNVTRIHNDAEKSWFADRTTGLGSFNTYLALFPIVQFEINSSVIPSIGKKGLTHSAPYPNPSRGVSYIKLKADANKEHLTSVNILSIDGRLVAAKQVSNFGQGEYEVQLPTEGLRTGVYLVQVNTNGIGYTTKLVIE